MVMNQYQKPIPQLEIRDGSGPVSRCACTIPVLKRDADQTCHPASAENMSTVTDKCMKSCELIPRSKWLPNVTICKEQDEVGRDIMKYSLKSDATDIF